MQRKIKFLTICFFLTFFVHKALSTNYYVLFDASCMDRLLYSNNESGATSEYLVYRINTNASEHIFLEIGSENPRTQEVLPTQVFTCGSNAFDSKMVDGMNSGKDRIFLVIRKENNQYSISSVSQASYYRYAEGKIAYESPRYAFNLDARRGIIGENIATARKTIMYFEGKLENDCTGAFLFTQKTNGEPRPYSDLVFVPEIGITEIRNGQDATDALNHILKLEKVNNYPVTDYLRLLCKRAQPDPGTQLVERGVVQEYEVTPQVTYPRNNAVTNPTVSSNLSNRLSNSTATRTINNPCGIEPTVGYHVVTKGETLYRIAKTHGVTVAQIQAWNNLGKSTNIHNCDRLRVAPLNTTGSAASTATGKVINPSTSVVNVPAPYENSFAAKGSQQLQDFSEPGWKTNEVYHIAKRGETVASIALKYGFTEARLRDINGMSRTEVVREGQPLKVNECPPTGTTYTNIPTEFGNTTRGEFTSKSPYEYQNDVKISPRFYQPSQTELSKQAENNTINPELAKRVSATGNDNTIPQNYDVNNLPRSQRSIHLVKEGENLYQISRAYGITVDRLRQLNSLGPNDVIIPYQKLYVN